MNKQPYHNDIIVIRRSRIMRDGRTKTVEHSVTELEAFYNKIPIEQLMAYYYNWLGAQLDRADE